MGKVNNCLKWSSICVLGVIVAVCLLLLGIALFLHGIMIYDRQAEEGIVGVHFLYGFTIVTLVLAVFGGFGTLKEKKWALIVFTVGMSLGCLLMIVSEILLLVLKSQLENHIRNQYLRILPLTNATQYDLVDLNFAQRNLQCCGVQGHTDWNNNIPASCECDSEARNPCVEGIVDGQSVMIYAKPCLSIMITESMRHLNILSGIRVGFILLWMLSIGLCIAILCRMKKPETPAVVYSQEAKAGNYSCLIESPLS